MTTRYVVTVEVTINAITQTLAEERVNKALVCLENSLKYADPVVVIADRTVLEGI